MKMLRSVELRPYNTMRINATAINLFIINHITDLHQLSLSAQECAKSGLVVGGGSNILLIKNQFDYVMLNKITGIEIVDDNAHTITLRVGAGEHWDNFVKYCVENKYYGLENLSLIPGSVGAAPIQNIGAYGVEINEFIEWVEVWDRQLSTTHRINNSECDFSYRHSRFKTDWKDKYIITHVGLRLHKKPCFNLSYPALANHLSTLQLTHSAQNIRDAVISIRQTKLPDPNLIPNTGSFFKNPIITAECYHTLKQTHPNMPGYPITKTTIKLPAAWLIENCGFKGKQLGQAGVHANQALVLINLGKADGHDILQLAQLIQKTIKHKFTIDLDFEVNIL
jgi:UDP-N-acetylmuramate dehydrogenase